MFSTEFLLPLLPRAALSLATGLALARRGYRRGSLNESGAYAAAIVGFVTLFASAAMGLSLIAFYLSGSMLTRYKEAIKARVDADAKPGGGQRNALQVLCTAGVAALAAIVFAASASPTILSGSCGFMVGGEEPLLRRTAPIAFLAAIACAAGDTWASELGILAKSPPVLITTLQRVPKGTSGGVTLRGFLVSAAGGWLIGAVMALESVGLRWPAGAGAVPCAPRAASVPEWLVLPGLGLLAGLGGSVIDSLLGATVQRTWWDARTGKVTAILPSGAIESGEAFSPSLLDSVGERDRLRDEIAQARREAAAPAAAVDAAADGLRRRAAGVATAATGNLNDGPRELVIVCGVPWLSNEGVNLATTAVTAVLAAVVYEARFI